MAAPYGDGLFLNEPPAGYGLNITELFHIVEPKPGDPGNDSKVDTKYPNVAIITPDSINNRFGGMWAKEQLDLRMPFSTEMYLHLGHQYGKNGIAADGMTFTLHNDPDGINAIGGAGEGLGVCRGRKWNGTYWNGYPVTETHGTFLQNSLVIEFDTYRNAITDSAYVDDPGVAGSSHCALLIPRNTTIYAGDHKNVFYFTPAQEWEKFDVSWKPNDSGGGTLEYTFKGNSKYYIADDIISTFGGTKVWWGFTGATGYYTSVQAAAITKLPEQGVAAEKWVKNESGAEINKSAASPGETIIYIIRAMSQSSISIGPVIITDKISEYLDYTAGTVKVTTSSGLEFWVDSSYENGIITVETNRLLDNEGDWIEIMFNAVVKSNASLKTVYNTGIIKAEGLTKDEETNTTEFTVLSHEDPTKKVSDNSMAGRDGSTVKAGDEIIYDINYRNYSMEPADITVTDRLPVGVDYVTSNNGGNYNGDTHTVTWLIPNVSGGVIGTVSVTVCVNKKAAVRICNYASVQVGNDGPQFTNAVVNSVKGTHCFEYISDTECRKTVKGKIKWDDNKNSGNTRPDSVEVILARDGIYYSSISVTEEENWTFAFGCLPVWKNPREKYEYRIIQHFVFAHYETIINGYNIINKLIS